MYNRLEETERKIIQRLIDEGTIEFKTISFRVANKLITRNMCIYHTDQFYDVAHLYPNISQELPKLKNGEYFAPKTMELPDGTIKLSSIDICKSY